MENCRCHSGSSEEEPYVAITPAGTKSFILAKEYYDTSVAAGDCFVLTQNCAVNRSKSFLEQLISDLGLGYVATGKQVRPAWILYGEKKCLGGGDGRYIMDAVTGEVLTWENQFR